MVLRPEREAVARAIFEKWDLDFAVVGETIAEDRFLVLHQGEIMADLPLAALSGAAPEYDRPHAAPPAPPALGPIPEIDPIEALKALIGRPNHASKRWIWEQYDHMVLADTVRGPGSGAGIVRVHGTEKLLAFTSDVTPRYVAADPREGGKQAVAEAWRNLMATGATPLAATDNLNFGNPETPAIMGQFVAAVDGIGEACRALDMPIVSGNVSLYNETDGRPIPPTPTIGAAGLLTSADKLIGALPSEGDMAVLIGEEGRHLGQSALLAEAFGRAEGSPPPVDLARERRHGNFLHAQRDAIRAATDLSDGGLALAAFEMAVAADIGVTLEPTSPAALFGENQARYLIAVPASEAERLAAAGAAEGVPVSVVGRFEGDRVRLGDSEAPLSALHALYDSTLENAVG